jgi:hypothetical protein
MNCASAQEMKKRNLARSELQQLNYLLLLQNAWPAAGMYRKNVLKAC